jgi:hypothetical protein
MVIWMSLSYRSTCTESAEFVMLPLPPVFIAAVYRPLPYGTITIPW